LAKPWRFFKNFQGFGEKIYTLIPYTNTLHTPLGSLLNKTNKNKKNKTKQNLDRLSKRFFEDF